MNIPRSKHTDSIPPVLRRERDAFTLIEIMITTVLLVMLVTSGLFALAQLDRFSRRNAEFTSVLSLVSGTLEGLKASTYNPPVPPFGPDVNVSTNLTKIALSQDGKSYTMDGMVVTRIEPVANGHLITVTGYFTNWNLPYVVTLQNVLNSYSNPDE
jgi:prepilin-type N-terminal cleavage/methylation domain-containing protein